MRLPSHARAIEFEAALVPLSRELGERGGFLAMPVIEGWQLGELNDQSAPLAVVIGVASLLEQVCGEDRDGQANVK